MNGSSAATLLKLLVGVPSINPRERAEPAEEQIARVVADWLGGAGVEAELQRVLPGRPNVLARVPGRDRSRTFLLESHMDTVEVVGMKIDPSGLRHGD